MAFESCNESFRGVIPNLDGAIIGSGQEIWLVRLRVVFDMVDSLRLMRLESEVGRGTPQTPDFDGAIQTGGSKSVCVLGVDGQTHDIVRVALKHLHALPLLVPIPQLNGHVIAGGEHKWLRGMHDNGADVVGVRLKGRNLLRGVVVVDSQLEVVGAADNPVLARNKAAGADGHIGQFECLDDGLRFVRPDVDVAAVECREDLAMIVMVNTPLFGLKVLSFHGGREETHPWLSWVKVDALDALAAGE